MEHTIYRIGVLIFTGFIVWALNEPYCLFFLLLMLFFRKRETRKEITAEFDDIHARLDSIARQKSNVNHSLDDETKELLNKLTEKLN